MAGYYLLPIMHWLTHGGLSGWQLLQLMMLKRFEVNKLPKTGFDHKEIIKVALNRLKAKVTCQPVGFELLDKKFAFTKLHFYYECIFQRPIDKRNFSRKILSTGLLMKQKDKEKASSKRGAYYYKLDKRKYIAKFNAFLNFVPNPHKLK